MPPGPSTAVKAMEHKHVMTGRELLPNRMDNYLPSFVLGMMAGWIGNWYQSHGISYLSLSAWALLRAPHYSCHTICNDSAYLYRIYSIIRKFFLHACATVAFALRAVADAVRTRTEKLPYYRVHSVCFNRYLMSLSLTSIWRYIVTYIWILVGTRSFGYR
jgi:hypothetical protein